MKIQMQLWALLPLVTPKVHDCPRRLFFENHTFERDGEISTHVDDEKCGQYKLIAIDDSKTGLSSSHLSVIKCTMRNENYNYVWTVQDKNGRIVYARYVKCESHAYIRYSYAIMTL